MYPAVVITYLGQAAYLYSGDNNLDFDNTFYASIPTPVYWPMFVIAILAAIVASQVLMTYTINEVTSLILCHDIIHSPCATVLCWQLDPQSKAQRGLIALFQMFSSVWPLTAQASLHLLPCAAAPMLSTMVYVISSET